jgi:ribonuclease D
VPPSSTLQFTIVASNLQLERVLPELINEKAVAVDLEADSMYHFQEKVCLIQFSTAVHNYLIDPLAPVDMFQLSDFFADSGIKKIMHGADYDIRSLYRDFQFELNNLFDTEVACRFLGFKETGLNAVLQKHFNVSLNKKFQRKDWSKRPLSSDMLAYAANDTAFLIPLAKELERRLKSKGRLEWVEEECMLLQDVRPLENNGLPLFLKCKGAGRLPPRSLAVLEYLLAFRRQVAQKRDKPLFKIIGNRPLLEIAAFRPVTMEQLESLQVLSGRQQQMYGQELLKQVVKALALPEKELPIYPKKKAPRLDGQIPGRIQAIKEWRDAKAEILEIDPSLLCNRSMMCNMAIQNPQQLEQLDDIVKMKQWQKEAFGAEIVDVLKKYHK